MQEEDAGYPETPTTSSRRTIREELYPLVWQSLLLPSD